MQVKEKSIRPKNKGPKDRYFDNGKYTAKSICSRLTIDQPEHNAGHRP
jgi:hypothetical protein